MASSLAHQCSSIARQHQPDAIIDVLQGPQHRITAPGGASADQSGRYEGGLERRRRERALEEKKRLLYLVHIDALPGTGINLFVIKGVHQRRSASRTFRMRSQNGEKRLAYPGRT